MKKRRRRKLRSQPFPAEWREILESGVSYYRFLSPEDREELFGHIQVFLHEKRFEGLGGLAITDEIRLTIAAQACVLLLHRETDYFPSLISILVYPHKYQVETTRRLPDGTVEEGMETRLGESWHRGEVVLSWSDVRRDSLRIRDGFNVVFHEFAHQLDDEFGSHDGAPVLPDKTLYAEWARVMTAEYERLRSDIERYRPTLIDRYGATNPAEFFAVATETFFEKSVELRARHPELYEQLTIYYRQDPATRFEEPSLLH